MRTKIIVPVLLATLALAGCETTPAQQDAARQRELQRQQRVFTELTDRGLARTEQVQRVPNFRISGWQELDDRNLILRAGVRDRYLVTLLTTCQGLAFATGIGLQTATNSLGASDSILVRGTLDRVERCPIKEIWALEELPGYVDEETIQEPPPEEESAGEG